MRIAVCDDLPAERENLIPLLRDYCAANRLSADFVEYASGEELLRHFQPGEFVLIFLDVYMQGLSGVETARRLKQADPNCLIVFTTTSREHGVEAFELDVFHYLVKPIDPDKLRAVLNKWYNALCEVRTLALKCGRTTREVLIRDIIYIDVLGRSSSVHTASERIETAAPLSALEELLPDGEFIRPIRYCLAALRHIHSVGEDFLLLDNGENIPISRRERDNIKQTLAAYRLRALRRR